MLAETVNAFAVHFENFLSFGTKREKNFSLVSIIIKKTVKALATGLSFPDQTIHPTLSKRTKTASQPDRLEKVGLPRPLGPRKNTRSPVKVRLAFATLRKSSKFNEYRRTKNQSEITEESIDSSLREAYACANAETKPSQSERV